MKIAVFSDVHGNYDAFQRAMSFSRSQQVDAYFFLGDAVGYYYESLAVISDLMKLKNLYIVLGNHDNMFLQMYESKDEQSFQIYQEKYGSSFVDLFKEIRSEQYLFLKSIPTTRVVELDGIKFMLIHGGPNDELHERVYPDSSLDGFERINADVVLLGHTHYRMNRSIGGKVIINPGSLGQPRDGKEASFVIYDTKTNESLFLDVAFNVVRLKKQIRERGSEPNYLINVLDRIRKG